MCMRCCLFFIELNFIPLDTYFCIFLSLLNKMPMKCFLCFLTPAIKNIPRKTKLKTKVIRGTKDRPPLVPEKGCHTGSS